MPRRETKEAPGLSDGLGASAAAGAPNGELPGCVTGPKPVNGFETSPAAVGAGFGASEGLASAALGPKKLGIEDGVVVDVDGVRGADAGAAGLAKKFGMDVLLLVYAAVYVSPVAPIQV